MKIKEPYAVPLFIQKDKKLTEGRCRSCNQPMWWAVTLKGKLHPLNDDGTSHFGTCPQGKTWSKKGEAR